uniref:Ig-like domain-containing protein n=1 Tax=Heliothis virescens TaxID=7102 RepID=A0A2A4K5H7_HELVI
MFGRTMLVLLLLWTQDAVRSLRLVELRVPTHEPEGGMALLGCQYDLEGDTLYSVKWYKDGREFYRFVPKNDPPVYYFQTPGVNVETVVNFGASPDTSQRYCPLTPAHCELRCLSGHLAGYCPADSCVRFTRATTVFEERVLPKGRPRVTGLREQYNFDDLVVANCSLPPSRPKAHLKWLVNDKPAPSSYILGPWYRVSAERPDAAETILQLSFYATTSDFINGAIKLKCQATIAPLYQRETESTHYIALPYSIDTDAPEAKEIKDEATAVDDSLASLLIPILFLILM